VADIFKTFTVLGGPSDDAKKSLDGPGIELSPGESESSEFTFEKTAEQHRVEFELGSNYTSATCEVFTSTTNGDYTAPIPDSGPLAIVVEQKGAPKRTQCEYPKGFFFRTLRCILYIFGL